MSAEIVLLALSVVTLLAVVGFAYISARPPQASDQDETRHRPGKSRRTDQ